ncbi:MAG: lipopolysaccharide biosynthesis protein, partial [Parabacteroides sp.]|nr:lipopolysaccharide biosynthesis protein [Parabacteroides sp.]
MAEQTLKEKTAKGLFWGGLSNGVQQFLGMVFGIFLARILTVEDYGLVGMLTIFIAIANSISESGFTAALTNKPEFRHEDYNAVFWFTIIVGTSLYVLLFLLAPVISLFFERPELTSLSRILFLLILPSTFVTSYNAILFRKMLVKEKAKMDLVALFVSGIIGVCMANMGYGYWALVCQSMVYAFLGFLLRIFFISWRPSFHINLSPIKSMYTFGVKLFITNIFNHINNNIFSILLGKYYSAVDVGFYTQGNKWMNMGSNIINGMIMGVAQPVLSTTKSEEGRFINILRKLIRFSTFISFPSMFGLAFISNEFILITIGEKWLPCVPILQLFCVWGAFSPIQLLYSQVTVSLGRSDFYLYSYVLIGCIQLFLALFTIRYGLIFMLVVYISVYTIIWLSIWHIYVNNLVRINIKDIFKDIIPYLVASLFSIVIANWCLDL